MGLLGTTAITDFPEFWTDLAKANIPGTPIPVIMIPFVVLAIVFAVLLHFTPFGRSLYAIGLNKEAARVLGHRRRAHEVHPLRAERHRGSGFAGVYFTLLYSNARGDNATGMELQVIAAVLLGGVSIFGGRGALHGVIAGVLLIGTLGSALRLAGVTVRHHQRHHRSAARALGGVGKPPRLAPQEADLGDREEEGAQRDVGRLALSSRTCNHRPITGTMKGNNDVQS